MLVVYLAGPYRDERGAFYVDKNIQNAREHAAALWEMGHAVFCPHLNTAHFDGLVDEAVIMRGLLEILKLVDVVVVMPGAEDSKGTQLEIETAYANGVPVLHWDERSEIVRL